MSSEAKAGICCSRAAATRITSTCMFNCQTFNKVSTQVLTLKNDLELNSELLLINKYKSSNSDEYKQAIVLIFKDRGYTKLEIGQLLGR